jgi:hypothetical protein
MPDDDTPAPKPEDAYPPPSSAYPPPSNPPPNTPPETPYSNPYGTPNVPPANPYGTPSTPPANPYGTPSTPLNNPYSQGQSTPPSQPTGSDYGTPGAQSNWQPPPPVSGYGGTAPPYSPVNGTLILILGILSIVICCVGIILGPISWIMGNNALKTLDQYGDALGQRSNVNTGRICGIVGTIVGALVLISNIISFVLRMATSGMHSSY